MGNHEEPLRYYTVFLKDISHYIQDWIRTEKEAFARKEQLLESSKKLLKEVEDSYTFDTTWKKFKRRINLLRYNQELDLSTSLRNHQNQRQIEVNEEIIKELPNYEEEAFKIMMAFTTSSYKHTDKFIEKIRKYPMAFNALKKAIYKYKLPSELVKDPEYGFHKIKRTSLGTMKHFLLSDIKYTEIMDFVKRCAQMFYGDFHGQRILITHGGLVRVPDKATPTADMIRGVGGYEDAELCMKTFSELYPDVIQIHGHRNMTSLPVQITPTTFNVNGDVDLGLKAVTINKNKTIEITEISPKQSTKEFFRKAQIEKAKKFKAKKLTAEEEGRGLLQLFQDHAHVDIKKLPNNVAAINFTKKAFDNGIWDNITIKARGLFVKIEDNLEDDEINVVARGYQKFFNVGERNGYKTRDIRELAYPIMAYEKINGYLGLLSIDENEWFISSKSTTEGDFAKKFKEMITPSLTDELKNKMIEENITLVFEVVEPQWDPHIEIYEEPELVILDAIRNDINFEKLPYERIPEFIEVMAPQSINVREKKLVKICENFNDYWSLVSSTNQHPLLSDDGIEGYVFEDSSSPVNLFKLKTDWYSFWKFMRGVKQRIVSKIKKHGDRTGNYTLEKSDSISMKQNLHREEDFKVFTFMVEMAEKDLEAFNQMSIIDIRNKFLEANS